MLLEIENLVKQYKNGPRANDGISLCVEQGEVFGLLGPNGAGKTTLINHINLYRFDGDKIAETWQLVDIAGLLRQIGALVIYQ